jgi:stage III sporulation protein AB
MTIQITGAVLICAATTLLGFHIGGAGRRRSRDLMEFKKSMILLKSQIDYAIYTLPRAFSHIAQRSVPPFDSFYEKLAADIDDGADASASWNENITNLKDSNLHKDDLSNFALLGTSLGHMDKDVQINSIDMIITNIDDTLTRLLTENPKNSRMYRGLGIVSGLLITIVLI